MAVVLKSFLLAALVVLSSAVLAESALKTDPRSSSQKFVFDSTRDRDRRFHDLYLDLQLTELQDFDKRLAFTLQGDPLLAAQFILSLYILVNQVIEPLVSVELRSRLRFQNLLSGIATCFVDIGFRFHVPADHADVPGIFADDLSLSTAQRDMRSVAKSRVGQQIAYSVISLLSGAPAGCVLPLIIRSVPYIMKSLLLLAAAYSPQLTAIEKKQEEGGGGKKKKGPRVKVKQNIVSRLMLVKRQPPSSPSSPPTTATSISASGDAECREDSSKEDKNSSGKSQEQSIAAVAAARERDTLQLLVEFACEASSLALELGILAHIVLTKFLDFNNVKAGLFVIWFRLLTSSMILQYLFVRVTQSLKLFREAVASVPLLRGLAPMLESVVSTAVNLRSELYKLKALISSRKGGGDAAGNNSSKTTVVAGAKKQKKKSVVSSSSSKVKSKMSIKKPAAVTKSSSPDSPVRDDDNKEEEEPVHSQSNGMNNGRIDLNSSRRSSKSDGNAGTGNTTSSSRSGGIIDNDNNVSSKGGVSKEKKGRGKQGRKKSNQLR